MKVGYSKGLVALSCSLREDWDEPQKKKKRGKVKWSGFLSRTNVLGGLEYRSHISSDSSLPSCLRCFKSCIISSTIETGKSYAEICITRKLRFCSACKQAAFIVCWSASSAILQRSAHDSNRLMNILKQSYEVLCSLSVWKLSAEFLVIKGSFHPIRCVFVKYNNAQ